MPREYFTWITLLAAAVIILSPFFLKRKQSISELSVLVTTFGILGTFIGILIGLFYFNVNNIEESVPLLLEGLKIAFVTSIAGMITGILVKLFPWLYRIKIEDSLLEMDQTEAIIKLLSETNEYQKDQTEAITKLLPEINKFQREAILEQRKHFQNIEKAICGDGETTMLTQLQKMRTTVSDKQDELIKEFKTFAQTMAENNANALIDALTQVMQEFNVIITEQLGDNFKRLNESIEKILIWQDNYKEQIELMIQQFERSLEGIEKSEESLTTIRKEAEQFTLVATSLEELISSLNLERQRLRENLDAFAEIAQKATNAFPIIEENLEKLTTQFARRVEESVENSISILKINQDSITQQAEILKNSHNNLNDQLSQVVNNLNDNIDKLMTQNAERIAQQISELDKQLGDELNKSLSALGRHLVSLSEKFVNDYSPLTDKLKELINRLDVGR